MASLIPTNGDDVTSWCGSCILLFIAVAYGTRAYHHGWLNVKKNEIFMALFNGSSFGTGSLLTLTLWHPALRPLMSDQELWLGVAGFASVVASLTGLIGRGEQSPPSDGG